MKTAGLYQPRTIPGPVVNRPVSAAQLAAAVAKRIPEKWGPGGGNGPQPNNPDNPYPLRVEGYEETECAVCHSPIADSKVVVKTKGTETVLIHESCWAERRRLQDLEREAQRSAERKRARRVDLEDRVERVLRQFPKWDGARVTNVEWMDRVNAQLATLALQYTPGDGHVLILGPTGFNKTMMLAALAHRWAGEVVAAGRMDPAFAGVVWAKAFKLGECARWHRLGDGEPPEITRARDATVLFLDDLGQENAGAEQTLFALLDDRYDRGSPCLVSSGLTTEQLKQRYGAHLFRRIVETGVGSLIDMHPRGKLQAVR